MEKLDKKTYRGIVKFTLESMLNLSKTDKNYNLAADTIYYYENTIVPEGQITQAPEGFLENWFPWSLFVQKGKEEMTKEERKKRVQEAWKKLKNNQ